MTKDLKFQRSAMAPVGIVAVVSMKHHLEQEEGEDRRIIGHRRREKTLGPQEAEVFPKSLRRTPVE